MIKLFHDPTYSKLIKGTRVGEGFFLKNLSNFCLSRLKLFKQIKKHNNLNQLGLLSKTNKGKNLESLPELSVEVNRLCAFRT